MNECLCPDQPQVQPAFPPLLRCGMARRARSALALTLALGAASVAPAGAAIPVGPFCGDTLTSAQQQSGSLLQDGVPAPCGLAKSCPGSSGPNVQYVAFPFTNDTGEDQCVTVSAQSSCTGSSPMDVTAYLGSFVPSNICTNYLGDSGAQIGTGNTTSFTVNVPAGQNFVVVVNSHSPGNDCGSFCFTMSADVPTTPTPTPTEIPAPTETPTPTSTSTPTPTPIATDTPTPSPSPTPTNTPEAGSDPDHFVCYEAKVTGKVCVNREGETCMKDADCGGVKGSCTDQATRFAKISSVMLSDEFATDATFKIEAPDRICAPASKTFGSQTTTADIDATHLLRFRLGAQEHAVTTLFPPAGCATCEGGATYLRLKFTATSAASVRIFDRKGRALLDRSVAAGEEFDLSGTEKNGTFQGPLQIWVNGTLRGALVTDCAEALGPGLVPATSFVVLDARSAKTGTESLCPVIKVQNQFETVYVTRGPAHRILVPSLKNLPAAGEFPNEPQPPEDVDHFACYDIKIAGVRPDLVAQTSDQFYTDLSRPKLGPARNLSVLTPKSLCNPALKEGPVPGAQPQDPEAVHGHLLCYDVKPLNAPNQEVKGLYLEDQLGQQRLDLGPVKELCLPSSIEAPAPVP